MTRRLALWSIFLLTAAVIALFPDPREPDAKRLPNPASPVHRPGVDVVFVLDTTGSMGSVLDAARQKIWSIATTLASARPAPCAIDPGHARTHSPVCRLRPTVSQEATASGCR